MVLSNSTISCEKTIVIHMIQKLVNISNVLTVYSVRVFEMRYF
jgi:hypothetical protein